MSQGLQVWDGSGNQILTVTDRITRFIQSTAVFVNYQVNNGTVVIPVAGLVLDGTWFVYASTGDSIASFTCTVSTGSVTLQAIGTFQNTVNVLVFRA
jgi:hypothetical protein